MESLKTQIRDSRGNVIKDDTSGLRRWAEFVEGILNAQEPDELIEFSSYTSAEEINISQDPPSRDELYKPKAAIKELKHLEPTNLFRTAQ